MESAAPAQCRSVRSTGVGDPGASAIRSAPGVGTVPNSGLSAITASINAASATVVASGPFSAIPNQELGPISAGTTPPPGLIPNSPQQAAGNLIEPKPSAAWAIGTMPEATAAALPPDDPPVPRPGFLGFLVMADGESVLPQMHSSGTAVMPTTTAPAAFSRATTG